MRLPLLPPLTARQGVAGCRQLPAPATRLGAPAAAQSEVSPGPRAPGWGCATTRRGSGAAGCSQGDGPVALRGLGEVARSNTGPAPGARPAPGTARVLSGPGAPGALSMAHGPVAPARPGMAAPSRPGQGANIGATGPVAHAAGAVGAASAAGARPGSASAGKLALVVIMRSMSSMPRTRSWFSVVSSCSRCCSISVCIVLSFSSSSPCAERSSLS
mmetsp:Transcript_38674/g.122934  ORF Transcript_38674/g.122934 Transcript_38674/m.122934 type:complete len:216 (-) Transcript_38674:362-1009(-)